MCRVKNSCLFKLGAEKIEFPNFYIPAFCSVTNRPTENIYIYRIDAHI